MSTETEVLSTIKDIIKFEEGRSDNCVLQYIVDVVVSYISSKDICHANDLED